MARNRSRRSTVTVNVINQAPVIKNRSKKKEEKMILDNFDESGFYPYRE